MTKDRLKELAANPAFISGIYNYCDRWCERCRFTSRCLNFATLRAQDQSANPHPAGETDGKQIDKKTIDYVMDAFRLAAEMIEEIAQKEGIDLTDVEPLPKAPPNTLSRRAKEYFDAVDSWISKYEVPLAACIEQEERQIEVVGDRPPLRETVKARLEVCTRQATLIALKVARAFEHHAPEAIDDDDANGSAKAALVAIDESIVAWLDIVRAIDHPFVKKEARDLAGNLEGLRAQIERVRPGARTFVRPGFDESCWAGEVSAAP